MPETLLLTGFPGFLGSALLPRLLARRPGAEAVCVVQERFEPLARRRLAELAADAPGLDGRVRFATGDITAPGLGLAPGALAPGDVTELWHLAAVYDLAVEEGLARRVNVDGTRHVLDLAESLPGLRRLQYVSTCYVSGAYPGEFSEDDLVVAQRFNNHYESTKFLAEVLVRERMARGLPATVYRPGIVVGDSATGATQKYDGPYFLLRFLLRQPQPAVALMPQVADPSSVRVALVPRDYVVGAMDELSVLPASEGATYALADPAPPTVREIVSTFAGLLGRRVGWLPLPHRAARGLLDRVAPLERLLGVPAETLDYFAHPTTYGTARARADLAASGLVCPPFASYAERMVAFVRAHPDVSSAALV